MHEHLGETQGDALCKALQESEPEVSVRLNPTKVGEGRVEGDVVPWCPGAYYLAERPAFTFDPLLHAGVYYVQEASSMFLSQALRQYMPQDRALVALDLCAAPGGKSTLLRSHLSDDSLLVSNEPMRQRAQVLAENITKWGHPNCVVTNNYPADFAGFASTFDLVVADVPCSGEGMFRKDDEAIEDWSLENVDTCWRRQREIVGTIWPCLKPGGLMIYSTCTFNRLEDEDNVEWIAQQLGAEILPVNHEAEWGIAEGNPGYHFFPGQTRGEGFYMAVLRKKGEVTEEETTVAPPKRASQKGARQSAQKVNLPAITLPQGYVMKADKDVAYAVAVHHEVLMLRLHRMLRCLLTGVEVATLKGKDWVPAHALALSTLLGEEYPRHELTYAEAISYLRREALRIEAPRGYVVVTYEGHPLGWVKSIGNRANNLYPQDWRIRTTYTPEERPEVVRWSGEE